MVGGGDAVSHSAPADDALADQVLHRLAPLRLGPPRWLRWVLAIVASVQLLVALPWLVGADPLGLMGDATASHLTRDGALGLAIATAGLVTAWRPRYAVAATLVALALFVAQVITAVIDGHQDRVSLLVEAVHVSTLMVTALVAFASRPARPLSGAPRAVLLVHDREVD